MIYDPEGSGLRWHSVYNFGFTISEGRCLESLKVSLMLEQLQQGEGGPICFGGRKQEYLYLYYGERI